MAPPRSIYLFNPNFLEEHTEWNVRVAHSTARFFSHTLQLKICHLECFPFVCIGKPCTCNVLSPPSTLYERAWPCVHINVTSFRPNLPKLLCRKPACILGLCYVCGHATTSSTVNLTILWDNNFFCLECWLN